MNDNSKASMASTGDDPEVTLKLGMLIISQVYSSKRRTETKKCGDLREIHWDRELPWGHCFQRDPKRTHNSVTHPTRNDQCIFIL